MRLKKTIFLMLAAFFTLLQACTADEPMAQQQDQSPERTTHVSMDQARNRLAKVLEAMNPSTRSNSLNIGEGVALSKNNKPLTRSGEEDAWYYYFPINDGEKFAIMSARTDMPELLATGNGTPDKDNPAALVPDTLRWNINNVRRSISVPVDSTWLAENDTVFYERGFTYYYFPYRHLCPVKWNQNYPFNKYIDFDPRINDIPNAGCVAIAMVHFMAAAKCRPSHYKNIPLDWETWIKYPTVDSLKSHPEALDSVAKLLYYLGLKENLDMQYGYDGYTSVTYDYKIPPTLENFGFYDGGQIAPFSENAVIHEFDRGYPVIISGSSTKLPIGHTWILDGLMVAETVVKVYNRKECIGQYTEQVYYFDVNWGWSGQGDGFYLSTGFNSLVPPDFNPDNNPVNNSQRPWEPWGANFDGYKTILVGVKKDSTEK